MQNVERLSITLPKDMVKVLRGAVSGGGYASNSEVIREAVRMWQDANATRLQRLADMRKAIAEADADTRPYVSDADVEKHFKSRLKQAQAKHRERG
jgi:antitoxin ParD1/3/4